ncbi:Ribonuclease HII [uncultured Desulfatiglans sp.]|uniref:Ribonuclease HII n=1 Tax=Uncultured Desulfatiglans sp. TaxID=1748965 RepID=A0A653A1F6_UNCDX|nr:Ribonuclease HII [uncultured Desulfatiglans sp.]
MAKRQRNLRLFDMPGAEEPVEPLGYENEARSNGFHHVAGVDEAGRGCLAGPVVAAAVILPEGVDLPGVRDSKCMTAAAREKAFQMIQLKALAAAIGVVSPAAIDRINILRASLEAMRRAVAALDPVADFLLVDGIHPVPVATPQRALKKGDRICRSISAASVLAKVYRDRLMGAYHQQYPAYAFDCNKGYGTRDHLSVLRKIGWCPIHRTTFKGVCRP